MAIPFINARIFFGGYEPTSRFNQVSLEFEAESLDETTFGMTSRQMKGGLKRARMQGSGFIAFGVNEVERVFFDAIDQLDAVVMLAPETVAEGSTSSGFMYGFKSDLLRYTPHGGRVGELMPFTILAEGRGI